MDLWKRKEALNAEIYTIMHSSYDRAFSWNLTYGSHTVKKGCVTTLTVAPATHTTLRSDI